MRRRRPRRGPRPGGGRGGHRPGGGRGAGRAGRGGRGRHRRGRPGGASATTWSARRRGWSCRPRPARRARRMGAYCRGGMLQGRADAAPAMIAHHLLEALPIGDAGGAASWAERAAAAAMAQLAGRTPRFSMRGGAGRGPAGRPGPRLCGLALARLRGFDLTGGSSTLREAAGAARSAGDPALIGEVALVMEGYTDPGWVSLGKALCDEALAGLPPATRRCGPGCWRGGRPRPPITGSRRPGRCPGRRWPWPNGSAIRRPCVPRCAPGSWPAAGRKGRLTGWSWARGCSPSGSPTATTRRCCGAAVAGGRVRAARPGR